jgi:hypothetical protein
MSETVKSEKLSHQYKNGSNTNNFGEMRNSMLQWHGHVVCKVKWEKTVMKGDDEVE